jgi:hypothetical protein
MDTKELLGILATLATIAVGMVAILDHMGEDAAPAAILPQAPQPPNDTKIVVLARATFNDRGQTYILDYDGNLLKLNSSIMVVG